MKEPLITDGKFARLLEVDVGRTVEFDVKIVEQFMRLHSVLMAGRSIVVDSFVLLFSWMIVRSCCRGPAT